MSSNASQVDTLLRQMGSAYRDATKIKQHYLQVNTQYPTLYPQIGTLVRNNGTTATLLHFKGTVPIYYVGAQYNIPLEIWLNENYPLTPPTAYVRPTPGMLLKTPHRHMDTNGMVYLPYLHEWNAYNSNLEGLVATLSVVFSDDPPVYSAAQGRQAQHPPERAQPARQSSWFSKGKSKEQKEKERKEAEAAEKNRKEAEMKEESLRAEEALRRVNVAELTERVQIALTAKLTEHNELEDTKEKLHQGEVAINRGVYGLTEEKTKLESSLEVLTQKDEEISAWLQMHERSGDVDMDDVVEPANIHSQQLLDEVSADAAIEDTLYILEKALRRENITTAEFLKEVKNLSRRQFFHKALVNKILKSQAAS